MNFRHKYNWFLNTLFVLAAIWMVCRAFITILLNLFHHNLHRRNNRTFISVLYTHSLAGWLARSLSLPLLWWLSFFKDTNFIKVVAFYVAAKKSKTNASLLYAHTLYIQQTFRGSPNTKTQPNTTTKNERNIQDNF